MLLIFNNYKFLPNYTSDYQNDINLVDYLNTPPGTSVKLVHFSTDYVYANSKQNASEKDVPVHDANWYTYTKVVSEPYIELRLDKYLILRATHKPRPFIFDKALISQVGNFDYVTEISKLSAELIKNKKTGVYNVGTPTKTMFDLAKRTKQDVKQILSPPEAPKNVTMSLRKLNDALKESDQEK